MNLMMVSDLANGADSNLFEKLCTFIRYHFELILPLGYVWEGAADKYSYY